MSLTEQMVKEYRRRVFGESIPRIRKCLNLLSEVEIWKQPNSEIPAVGNLVLHLCGNARQWMLSGLFNIDDERNRDAEFNSRGGWTKAELHALLDQLENDVDINLECVSEKLLHEIHKVQVFKESGMSIMIHVIEHFSYHTGQISLLTKYYTELDLGYYSGLDLNKK
ncbi:MAG TPA: DinB family protein [Flavobacteriales bacterium]|nr:DinB family protein [Flavobacteriales bacterium]